MDTTPLRVFLSSTCYDLVDLRFELKDFLEKKGMIVRLSDDPTSAFFVDPTSDSIASCLENIDQSDVVVCVMDRSYGPALPDFYKSKSAVHVEIEHARKMKRPTFYFFRDIAWTEFHQLKRSSTAPTQWIEKDDEDRRKKWLQLAKQIAKLVPKQEWSNWVTQFRSIVDLKTLVFRRLVATFPRQSIAASLLPDRLVRLHFVPSLSGSFTESSGVTGSFRNSCVLPAFDLVHGTKADGREPTFVGNSGVLGAGESLTSTQEKWSTYPVTFRNGVTQNTLFCEYWNTFNDRYRVAIEVRLEVDDFGGGASSKRVILGKERFFVGMPDNSNEWVEVGRQC